MFDKMEREGVFVKPFLDGHALDVQCYFSKDDNGYK
jgi:hypothetical protein